MVVSSLCLFLAALGEVADTFAVADDTGHVIHILAVAYGTFFERPFVDMAAVVADGVGYIESKVVASFGSRNS